MAEIRTPGSERLAIFVYGTLKRGQANHDRFCRGAVGIEAAVTRGRLFHLAAGYPALAVEPEMVLAEATGDPAADLTLQREWEERLSGGSRGSGSVAQGGAAEVRGEWMVFPDAAERLPSLDRFEGFRPGRRCLYRRVLVRCWVGSDRILRPAWTYVQLRPRGAPVVSGCWPG
jgi:gamma-glutamylcyclotransferase (GGCT)/AIG2-like uncharacterized protein YtfP